MTSFSNRNGCAPISNGSHNADPSANGICRYGKTSKDAPLGRYAAVRAASLQLAAPLSAEDQCVQSMPDASPTKWHLGHTTWFFETFFLEAHLPGYKSFSSTFPYLFNSYYETIGPRQPRPRRGLLTRPTLEEVLAYRRHVDSAMTQLLQHPLSSALMDLLDLGLNHEEQHQELILSDILHLFAQSPLHPAYDPRFRRKTTEASPQGLVGTLRTGRPLGHESEWLAFITDGGYKNPLHWLSDGWAVAQQESWTAPIYWVPADDTWMIMDLDGLHPLDPDAPVTHISYFEANAFATWANARLPTEQEWEFAVTTRGEALREVFDVAWQWTASAYSPYPGFRPAAGANSEYNGKFMSGQMVLRGGAATTPRGHTRATYRNFYHPQKQWMLSGLRLARDVDSEFAQDIVKWLAAPQDAPKPKYLYDAEGSRLFDEICKTREYYLTKTEAALLKSVSAELSATIPTGAALVEFGSGSSEKTHIVLDAAPQLSTYVPIEISPTALEEAAQEIRTKYSHLRVVPLVADFTTALQLPHSACSGARVGFFPGSTIGNFSPAGAKAFLRSARGLLGDDATFIIGYDIAKDEPTLVAAYDDATGVTRDFNKNLLVRINRELGGDFDPSAFDHRAVWNKAESRMEMHLVGRRDQTFHVAGREFSLKRGESLHTENSYKFTPESFEAMVAGAGWTTLRCWINEAPKFAVALIGPACKSVGEKMKSGSR
ncbi:unnamed protein product [Bemisia tabaci]|uniref:Uncharacterized protein n=1 Tax=Bemisia tabaci TaxID=7038 RepID=A0A9P0AGT7_BEMTA|nr:unnamed protein product [Bemisia tabaci]